VQWRARERIHWIVAQARGDVLDVGCSQGIVSVLCARLGLRVLGIDNEADRIEYALEERAATPPEVRDRLDFRVADATRLDLADDSFDTVLLGEVLEHLADPVPVLSEVARVCRHDGVVVITTPFGYSPHHDHRATFFPASLVKALGGHLTVVSLDIRDEYLCVIARPGEMTREQTEGLVMELQPMLEQRVLEIHRTMKRLRRKLRRERRASRKGLRRRALALLRTLRPRSAERPHEPPPEAQP
jgi:2-polyprenyl-6-hydroxyphenyl methylase/3-demethylubiquinone-9 3-methyltransferase